ncbi:pyridoxal phosphate-dependent aminotransferase [Carboxylicivirga sp. N1Y90]|uniref:pyridoxal phosphate-dependent aminotransferase n=1 Tax=Carboxylicivirga fragile TaxID=3417571 RepID=UPI003D347D43|nr:histidinol-phosphate aminotransferase family protein [Marinilabiliaceae bacterium N1Y90]
MRYVNKYLRNLAPYKLASHKIWDVPKSERSNILKLDWNEATIPPSPLVHERLMELMNDQPDYNLYPSSYCEELHKAFAEYAGVPKGNLQYFASSDVLHEYIARVFISVGDPVLILGPTYDNFRLTCEAQGGKVYYSEYTNDFTLSESRFENDIYRTNPSLVYICNPNNPTGNLLPLDYLERLLSTFTETLFLIDEAYFEFIGVTAKELIFKYDNILISRTMSKAFALASFRVGYMLSSVDNINTISKVRNPKNFTTFAQVAAIAALNDVKYMYDYVKEVNKAKKEFVQFISSMSPSLETFNDAGNFLLIRVSSLVNKNDLIAHFEASDIFVRDFAHSSLLLDCFRITIGTREQMKRVQGVIKQFLNK